MAEGTTPVNAIRDLVEISITQVKTATKMGNLESIFRAVAAEIWAMFSRAGDAPPIKTKPTSPVKRFEAREAVFA